MFADIRIGQPVAHRGLTVFPLLAEPASDIEYQLSEDAIQSGTLVVREIDEDGSIPEVLAVNRREGRVLALEGSPFVGARQDRVLTNSVLIPGRTEIRLPVSCVEQGRWDYRTREFRSGRWFASPKLRWVQRRAMNRSPASHRNHSTDQSAVWREIHRKQRTLGVDSETRSLADTFAAISHDIAESCDRLRYVSRASGMLAVGADMVVLDLFDKPSTCEKLWDRLVRGFLLDVLESRNAIDPPPGTSEAEELLCEMREAPWKRRRAVGDGQEYRAEMETGRSACRLVFQHRELHASVVGMRCRRRTLEPVG